MSENQELEVIHHDAIQSMERASIDSQVSTAKQFPRSLSSVKAQMLSFATLDIETAAGCFFTLPGRKGGDGKPIQGPSIRMAEIALSTYQNLRAGARVIADDGKTITAQGVCHDLQNNVCISVEVKRRVTNKEGKRYSEDMVVMTGNAACSIALRNATFRVVPLALVKPVYEQAKRVAIGDAKTLVTRRADALAHFVKMGVEKERVLNAVGCKALEDVTLEHMEILLGYATAIREGDTTIDEAFPVSKPNVPEPKFIAPGGLGSASVPQFVPETEPVEAAAPEVPEAPRTTRRMAREDKPATAPAIDAGEDQSKSALWSLLQMKGCADLGDLNSWLVTSGHSKTEFASWDDVPSTIVEKLTANDGFLIKQFIKKFGTK